MARVGHWTPARWAAAGAAGAPARADVMYGLVQPLADLAADAEDRPRRPVPRLDNDLALPDQLRVMVADLLIAAPPADPAQAASALESTAASLRRAIMAESARPAITSTDSSMVAGKVRGAR